MLCIVPGRVQEVLTKPSIFLQYLPMSLSQPTVSLDPAVLDLLLAYLDAEGLACADFRASLLALKSSSRLPIERWWALLEELHTLNPREDLGLAIGQCVEPRHAGVLGYLSMYSSSLGQALMRFHRFQPLLHNLVPTHFRVEGQAVVLGWSTERRSTPLSDDVVGSSLRRFAQLLTGRDDLRPSLIKSPNPVPHNPNMHSRFYGCPVEFNSPVNEIHFEAHTMSLPLNTQDAYLSTLLERQAEALLQALPKQDPLLTEVQREIVAVMRDGAPEMRQVALGLGMAERSLYRALQARGVRFQELLNSVRFELAKDYLQDSALSLPEIALLLGFADQSVFTRAFRQWSGEPPLRWRKAHQLF